MNRQVRLELARCREFPEGSREHGYEFSLPLSEEGRIDHDAWLRHRKGASFRRFWGGDEERGQLRHGRHGWALAFDPGNEEDELIFKGDEHRFAEGEYVSITERDGITRTFRVVTVR
jgi:hypothetical protein